MESNPSGAENFLHALAFVLHPPYEIVISGDLKDENTQEFLKETSKRFLPFKTQIHLPRQFEKSKIVELAPYLTAFTSSQKPTFFLCRDYACDQPRVDPKEVGNILNTLLVKNQDSLD